MYYIPHTFPHCFPQSLVWNEVRDFTADFNGQKYAEFFNKALLKNFISYINIFTTHEVSTIQKLEGLNDVSCVSFLTI